MTTHRERALGQARADLVALPDGDQRDHRYTSTACHHRLHQHCRRTCKFCGAYCRCSCHAGDEGLEVEPG